jgi:hypothetical protein
MDLLSHYGGEFVASDDLDRDGGCGLEADAGNQMRIRLEQVRCGQLGAWREEVVAQAAVDATGPIRW